jgi:hypothetical protein
MGTAGIVNLILQAIQAVIGEIAAIRGQGGMTDDQIAANTQTLLAANDSLYAALKSTLSIPTKPSAAGPTPAA